MTKVTHSERLVAIETELNVLRINLREMREDVKALLAVHNRKLGAAKLLAMLWAGLFSLGGLLGGVFLGKGHS